MKPKIRFKGFEGEWKAEELSHICSVNRGVRVTRNDLHNNGVYPVYQNTDYPMGYYTKFNVESNNPFVIVGGSAGLIGFCHTNFWAADDCVFFGDNPIINKSFLYNNLIFHKTEIKRNVRGASVPRLDRETLRKLPVSIPSLPEQQAIASYFTSLDSHISAATSRLASLKQMKAASLQAMFPQEGETVPKIRFQNNRWQKYKVGDLCDLLTGYPFPGDKILTKGKDLLMRGINITEGSIRHSNEIDRYYNEDTIGLEKYRLQVGDLVIGMDGSKVGKNSALVTSKEKNSLLVQRVARLRNEDKNLIKLIQIAVGSDNFIKYVEEMKTSSAIPHISPADIRNFPLSLPEDSNERRLIASYFTSLDRQISLQSQRLEKLKQIKSACLDKMFV